MTTRLARLRCPQLILVEPRHDRYAEASAEVMRVLGAWSPVIEHLSIDEAYLDLAGTEQLHGSLENAGRGLRAAVRAATGLTVSVGGGTSKVIAKVASDASKPDGLLVIPPGHEASWLAPQKIGVVPGIGPVARATLHELGIFTCGELAVAPSDHLLRRFGPHGADLAAAARGEDLAPVTPVDSRKSIGREMTLDEDVADPKVLERLLLGLVETVTFSLRRDGRLARTVSLKLKDGDFNSFGRQIRLPRPSDQTEPIFEAAKRILHAEARGGAYRLIGVSLSGLSADEQLSLFEARGDAKARAVTDAADRMREKYGEATVVRARLIPRNHH